MVPPSMHIRAIPPSTSVRRDIPLTHTPSQSIGEIDEDQVRAQEITSYVFLAISVLFLALTFGLIAPFK